MISNLILEDKVLIYWTIRLHEDRHPRAARRMRSHQSIQRPRSDDDSQSRSCIGIRQCRGTQPLSNIVSVNQLISNAHHQIVKPSEKTPLGSLAMGPLFERAGFPKGVVQVVTGGGDVCAMLSSHMRIRKVSFTGSIATGKAIQIAAAKSNLKRVTLELGGKSPAVIFDDANLDNALTWTINAILARSGQVYMAATRVYVQQSVADEFTRRYVERMREAANQLGDPQDPNVKMGPLVDAVQFERVKGIIARAREQAELVVGGGCRETGCYVEPTVFVNPKREAEIYNSEIVSIRGCGGGHCYLLMKDVVWTGVDRQDFRDGGGGAEDG